MIGRYGMDQLGQFIMYAVLVLIVVNVLVRGGDCVRCVGGPVICRDHNPVLPDVFQECG